MEAHKFRKLLEKELTPFKKMGLDKFDRGRKEHGEEISGIDYKSEFTQELFDLFDYFLMLHYEHQEAIKELQRLKEEGKCSQRYLAG